MRQSGWDNRCWRRLASWPRHPIDLRTANGGLVVRRAVKRTVTLIVVLVVVVAACGGDSEITVEDLVGTWLTDEPSYVEFKEDGSYSIAFSIEGLEDSPIELGQFTLEGSLFTFISGEESFFCVADDRGSYEMEVLDEGPSSEDRIEMILVDDECGIRGSTGDVIIERVP